jgi:hypothetical protein
MLDVRQAEQLVFTAAETIPDLEGQIEQQENFLSTLLGNDPGPIARGMTLTESHGRRLFHVPSAKRLSKTGHPGVKFLAGFWYPARHDFSFPLGGGVFDTQ